MSDAFDGFLAPAPPAGIRRHVSKANPRSTNPDDPYLAVDVEDWFRVSDHDGAVFDLPDVYEIHEITHHLATGKLYGFGHKVKRDGTPGLKPCGDAILIAWSDIPAHLHERLQPHA